MNLATSLSPAPAVTSITREQNIRHLPASAHAAFDRFMATDDPATLDPVLFAILDDYIPKRTKVPLAELPGGTQLIADLGFDSMAITEVVFFTEDLLGINITNEEIARVRSLDDLRGFIRQKLTLRPRR